MEWPTVLYSKTVNTLQTNLTLCTLAKMFHFETSFCLSVPHSYTLPWDFRTSQLDPPNILISDLGHAGKGGPAPVID